MPATPGAPPSRLLAAIAAANRALIAAQRVAVVVAHPDDETIGCGALLRRLQGVTVVHVTEGAPAAPAKGYATSEAYADARRRELRAALAIAAVPASAQRSLGFRDQETALQLAALTRRLGAMLDERGIDAVLTHSFEGGHPDHDATAFAVAAARRIRKREGRPLASIEMPFYHLGPGGGVNQVFARPGPAEVVVELSVEERARKRRMFAAHASQASVLATMSDARERFRPAPADDLAAPPNGGRVLYDTFGWAFTSARWAPLATAALAELGLETAACRCRS